MSESPDQTPLLEPADRETASIVPCGSCGYNVRGFAIGARCPACNAIISSLAAPKVPRVRKLEAADLVWLRTLASGMNWIVGGVVVAILARALDLAITLQTHSLAYGQLLFLFGGLLICVGCWKLTTREPDEAREAGFSVRLLLRYGQVISLAVGAFASQTIMASPSWWAAFVASGLVYVLVVIAGLTHVHELAVRIPDDELASQTVTVMWGFALALVLSQVWSILRFWQATVEHLPAGDGQASGTSVGISFTDTGVGSLTGLLGCFVGPLQLIFGIWAIVLVLRYRRALARVAKEALAARAAAVEQERRAGTEQ